MTETAKNTIGDGGSGGWAPRWQGLSAVLRREWLAQRRRLRLREPWMLAKLATIMLGFFVLISSIVMHIDLALIVLTLLLGLALIVPQTAGSIAREREQGTLEMLLLTPLRSSEILAGTLIAGCGPAFGVFVAILWALASLPGSMVSHWTPVLGLAYVGYAGMLGLACSTWFPTAARAIGATVAILVLEWVLGTLLLLPFTLLSMALADHDAQLSLSRVTVGLILMTGAVWLPLRGMAKAGLLHPAWLPSILIGVYFLVALLVARMILFPSAHWGDYLFSSDYPGAFLLSLLLRGLLIVVLFCFAAARLDALRRQP